MTVVPAFEHPVFRFVGPELEARLIKDLPELPAGIDIRVFDLVQLRDARLPSQPGALTPELARHWDEMFAWDPVAPTEYLRPELEFRPAALRTMPGDATASNSGAAAHLGGRWGTSSNWSGAVVSARDGKVFRRVAGTWIVPAAAVADGHVAGEKLPGKVYQCSVWIGLDGFRFASRSLPQVGTVSQWDPATGKAEYYLWVQWWVRGKMYGEVVVKNFVVEPGDEIRASIEVEPAKNDVRFSVTSSRAGRANRNVRLQWLEGQYTGDAGVVIDLPSLPDRQRGAAPVEGWHAVWCVERPAVMPPGATPDTKIDPRDIEIFRLPKLDGAIFRDALAEMRTPDDNPATAEERDMTGARFLRMVDTIRGSAPPRGVFLAAPQFPPEPGKRVQVDRLPPSGVIPSA